MWWLQFALLTQFVLLSLHAYLWYTPSILLWCSYITSVGLKQMVCMYFVNVCKIYFQITVHCLPLIGPSNGRIICSLKNHGAPSNGDTCDFLCNTGYELTGSYTRICQSDASWSGNETVCLRGKWCMHTYVRQVARAFTHNLYFSWLIKELIDPLITSTETNSK